MVGPFIFFDHMGPVEVRAGEGMDVRPHPHIALATITYLFEGVVFHRDSLGSAQTIRPGDVNWMIAGKGIAHSERTPPEARAVGHRMHGMQVWVALRKAEEDIDPKFIHQPASTLPFVKRDGVEVRLIAGKAFGHEVPPLTQTPTLYVDVKMAGGSTIDLPEGYEQRAIYVVSGDVAIAGETFSESTMVVFKAGASSSATARGDARVMILGGEAIDGERFIWWNFVASSKEKIEEAKVRWKDGKFPAIPGDDQELIPLPD